MGEIARPALGIIGGMIGGLPGYLVGSLLGGILFPPRSDQRPEDLATLRLAGPTLGSPLGFGFGQHRARGHVIWQGPLLEGGGKKGGKGGGGGKKGPGDESSRRSFIHAIEEGRPGLRLLRIWLNDDVVWDVTDPTPGEESGIDFTFYAGTGDQEPDPRAAAYQSGGWSGPQDRIVTESTTITGAGPSYTVLSPPVVSGSDVVWYLGGGTLDQIIYMRRVVSSPGQDEYTIDLATGLLTFGGAYSNRLITIRYRTPTAASAQEALAYPHVCYIYHHEPEVTGQTLPQYTYEIEAPLAASSPTGVVGWVRKTIPRVPPDTDPPPWQRNRFFAVLLNGSVVDLGLWGDGPVDMGGLGGEVGTWIVTGMTYNAVTERWYVGAVAYSGALVWGIQSAVFISSGPNPGGTFSAPGGERVGVTSFSGSWAGFEERLWDFTVDPATGDTFCWRDVPDTGGQGTGVIRITPDNTVYYLGNPPDVADKYSLTWHDGRLYWVGSTAGGGGRFGYWTPASGFVLVTTTGFPGGGPGAEVTRLESVAGRLYRGTSAGGGATYRLSGTTWVVQTGVGKIVDWHLDSRVGRILGIGANFIASTPFSTVSDAWSIVSSGISGTVGGLSIHPESLIPYYLVDEGEQCRLDRLTNGSGALVEVFPNENDIVRSRALVPGVITGAVQITASDVSPVDVAEAIMTDTRFGAGLPVALIHGASRTAIREFCATHDVFIAGIIESPASALRWVEEIMAHYHGWLAVRQGEFVFGAQREETVIREIVLDDTLEGGEIVFSLPGERDTRNRVRVDYTDRSLRYNVTPTYVSLDPDVAARGERAENLSLPFFATQARARAVATKTLALRSRPRAGYTMTLGPKELALAPGDVVAVTAARLGAIQHPVRVIQIGEDEQRTAFTVSLAYEPAAILALRPYPVQPPIPNDPVPPPFVDPGPTFLAVWEVPPELAGEDAIITAFLLSGTGHPEWRGASVYMATDDAGLDYHRVTTVLGASGRFGVIDVGRGIGVAYDGQARIGADLTPSLMTLASGVRSDALAGRTLAVLPGAQTLSYRDADLISSHRYRLRGLMRGWFEQAPARIAQTDRFAFIGDGTGLPQIAHPIARVGQTVRFKAVSINRMGVESSLADALATTMTIQGIARWPSPVYGLEAVIAGAPMGSRRVVGTGEITVGCRWRYARRDIAEDLEMVDGVGIAEKHPEFLDYRVRVWTRALPGNPWGLRRTVMQSGEAFSYTAAHNIADNGAYHALIRFGVSARRTNGVLSRERTIDLEVVQ